MTVPRLLALMRALGILISKRQLVRLLIAGQDGFLAESRALLRAGLSSAPWITVDDTGARHKAANSFCTQIGNAHFTWFGTTYSKSRLNFLELLSAGHDDYAINAEALAYMRHRAPVIARLAEHPDRFFADQSLWSAHLDRLGISALKVSPDPIMVATEGALWGSVKAHGFLPSTVIVSDDAGQFNVGQRGLCWVHAERLIHKFDTFTDQQRDAQSRTRELIWRFYRDLKAYRLQPTNRRKAVLRTRFDRIFTRRQATTALPRPGVRRRLGWHGWRPAPLVAPSASAARPDAHPGGQARRATRIGKAYSITSSASARILGGMSRPNAFAVARLMTSSNLVASSTGMSAGFSPLRMRVTYMPPRR